MIKCYARIFPVVAILAILSACSFKTLYNQLDYLIPEYVAGMVSLDAVVEEKVEQSTRVLLDWHRNTQLRQYADWLRAVQEDAGPQMTKGNVEQRFIEAERFWRLFTARLNDEMAHLLPLLGEEERNELFGSIAEKNEDYRKEFIELNDEDRKQGYYTRLLKTYKNWIGELTNEQEFAIKLAANKLHSTAELRLQRRLEWQNGIQQILSNGENIQLKEVHLREFLAGFENIEGQAMKEKSAKNKAILASLTVQISHSMTDEQESHFINKTNKYIRMFIELAENR